MKKIALILSFALGLMLQAQDLNPKYEFVLDLNVALDGGMIDIGKVPDGSRTIIPITGGTFEGPKIRGEVVAGGADYQLHSSNAPLSQVNAIYSLRTDDGVNIFIQNEGIISGDQQNPYFFTAPKFQAPVDSKYAWLNNSIYVCRPVSFGPGIKLRVWRVCDANALSSVESMFDPIPQSVFSEPKSKGKVETFRYKTDINGNSVEKRAQIYLPYGYNPKDKSKKYNIIYLIHGGGDNTTSFFSDPRSPLPLTRVLDHLIEDGTIDPVIVAAPTFYLDDTNIGTHTFDESVALTRDFHKELHDAIIPAIESNYNTYYKDNKDIEATRDHRAFGGFSMGALTTWYQLAYAPDDVKYYIPLSGDLWVYDNQGNKMSADVAAAWLNGKVAESKYPHDFVVFGYTGTDDIAGNPEKALFEALRTHAPLFKINQPDANARLVMKNGGKHYYGDINEYLYEILPLLWK